VGIIFWSEQAVDICHRREVTYPWALMADFDAELGENDLIHLPEILRLHDLRVTSFGTYEMFAPGPNAL